MECCRRRARAYYRANTEKLVIRKKAYRESPAGRAAAAAYKQPPKDSRQKFQERLLYGFGITVEEFARMLLEQKFCCACCGDRLKMDKHTHVDHDHDTGEIRSILCHHCNTALGMLKEDPVRIHALLHYLEKHK